MVNAEWRRVARDENASTVPCVKLLRWHGDAEEANLQHHIRSWGPKDPSAKWFEDLKNMPANREQWQMLCQLLSKRKTAECVYIAVLTIAYSAYRSAIFFPSACNCTPHPLCIFIFFTEMCNTTAVSGVLLAVQRCTMTKMCSIPKTEDKGVT